MTGAVVSWGDVEALIDQIEQQQRSKVIDLGRRLRAGLTAEDLRNPHDFPELADSAWQYEDGVLAGIQGVLAAIRAQRRQSDGNRP